MSNTYQIYLISDSTGETLDRIFIAIKAQFKNIDYKIHTYSFTRTENQIFKILSDAEKNQKFVLDNNNDSDASKIMEEGFCSSNPYLMYSDSDISNPTMISARDRKAQITIEKYGLDSSTNLKDLIDNGTITGGMIPKINNCLDVASNGVKGVVIIDGRKNHSVLFELLSDKGSGTLIRQ